VRQQRRRSFVCLLKVFQARMRVAGIRIDIARQRLLKVWSATIVQVRRRCEKISPQLSEFFPWICFFSSPCSSGVSREHSIGSSNPSEVPKANGFHKPCVIPPNQQDHIRFPDRRLTICCQHHDSPQFFDRWRLSTAFLLQAPAHPTRPSEIGQASRRKSTPLPFNLTPSLPWQLGVPASSLL
jgi:hypothetical protein